MNDASSRRDRRRIAFEALSASLMAAILLAFGWMTLIAGGATLSGGRYREPAWVDGAEASLLATVSFCAALATMSWVGRRLRWPALLHVMVAIFLLVPPLMYAALYGMPTH